MMASFFATLEILPNCNVFIKQTSHLFFCQLLSEDFEMRAALHFKVSHHVLFGILCVFFLGQTNSDSNVCPAISAGSLCPSDPIFHSRPYIDGSKVFVGGKVRNFDGKSANATTPILNSISRERIVIGQLAQMEESDALSAIHAAKTAWANGQGVGYR